MPRRKSIQDDASAASEPRSLRKRSPDDAPGEFEATPSKRRRSVASDVVNGDADTIMALGDATIPNGEANGDDVVEQAADAKPEPPQVVATPRRRGRPPKSASRTGTPTSKAGTPVFATPVKNADSATTTPRRQAADRSARKKSARALIENVVRNGDSDDDDEDDENLVREIYEDSDADDADDDEQEAEDHARGGDAVQANGAAVDETAATPSKTPQRRRRKAKSPTPPRDLPPHELYFTHNKPGRPKTSDNTLATAVAGDGGLLSHEEYFDVLRRHEDRHAADVAYLEALHAESFPQWAFELDQGFSLCLYGFGSKAGLLRRFARHLHAHADGLRETRRTVVVNGYEHTTTMREVLAVVADAISPKQKLPGAITPAAILAHLSSAAPAVAEDNLVLTLVVNSIDAPPLRKPGAQAALAQLASHPRVRLVCSADTPDFPLLWDIGVRSAFSFVFHDCTTFAPLRVELDVVDEVHELLGRTARRVNGREGVAFVLRSLPENAKNLFRLLVGEVLIAMEDDGAGGASDEPAGVEYRMVYSKAVEEFICSSEMAFRTLLKEFHDHQMITSRKDALGTELLSVPFQKDELEAILEDLMS